MATTYAFQIDGTITALMSYPMVVGLSGGGFVVAWDLGGDNVSLNYRVFDASGNAVTSVQTLSAMYGNHQHLNDLIALPNGGFAMSWLDDSETFSSEETGLFVQEFSASGAASAPAYRVAKQTILFDPSPNGFLTDGRSLEPHYGLNLAVNQQGDLIGLPESAYYIETTTDTARPWLTLRDFNNAIFTVDLSGNGYGDRNQVSPTDDSVIAGAFQGEGDIAFLDNDAAMFVYIDNRGGGSINKGVYARRLDDDGAPTADIFLVAENERTQSDARATTLENGNVLITWNATSGNDPLIKVYGRIVDGSGVFQTSAFGLEGLEFGDRGHQTITPLKDGGFLFSDGQNTSRFSSNGSLVSSDFTVFQDNHTGDRIAASSILADGSIVLVSSSIYDSQTRDNDLFARIIEIDGGSGGTSGSAGNDVFNSTASNETFDGEGGLDTVVIAASRDQLTTNVNGAIVTVSGGGLGNDTYTNIERLQMNDGTLALDVDAGENAGSAYRVYQAAFARTPDNDGLKFWLGQIDNGTSLYDVARGFLSSAEFQSIYGANPTSEQYVARLYQNVLGREGEAGGVAFWTGELNNGVRDMATILTNFSESPENIAGVAPNINSGIFIV